MLLNFPKKGVTAKTRLGLVIFFCLFWPGLLFSAPAPAGAKFEINFNFKDNNNQLRNKKAPTGGDIWSGYAKPYDGYCETIWIEGPFDPAIPCEIINFERTAPSVKLVKTLHYYAHGNNYTETAKFPNTWVQPDYSTPDFVAALIRAGQYYYCPDMTVIEHDETCTGAAAILGSLDAQRQNRQSGGLYKLPNPGITELAHSWMGAAGMIVYAKNGDITKLTDGVSSATRYPTLGTGAVSHTWDLKDYSGSQIEKGHYVVWVQMSAERMPIEMEEGTLVNGKEVVHLETCWDDPAYDQVGHHRVVEMFYFGDSSFQKTVYQEKKWSGDQYNYMSSGGMTFSYNAPTAVQALPKNDLSGLSLFPNPKPRNAALKIRVPQMGKNRGRPARLEVILPNGKRVRGLAVSREGFATWKGLDRAGRPVPAGLYLVRAEGGPLRTARPVLVSP